jgi:hypothetical protein
MASNTIIPSSEINVSDKTVAVDNLRPESPTPLQSSDGTLIIEYSPSTARPMKEIELVIGLFESTLSAGGIIICTLFTSGFSALFVAL